MRPPRSLQHRGQQSPLAVNLKASPADGRRPVSSPSLNQQRRPDLSPAFSRRQSPERGYGVRGHSSTLYFLIKMRCCQVGVCWVTDPGRPGIFCHLRQAPMASTAGRTQDGTKEQGSPARRKRSTQNPEPGAEESPAAWEPGCPGSGSPRGTHCPTPAGPMLGSRAGHISQDKCHPVPCQCPKGTGGGSSSRQTVLEGGRKGLEGPWLGRCPCQGAPDASSWGWSQPWSP